MRIIAGQWRGRRLKAPPGDATRPTADRTRETLFSMLASRLGSFEGLSVVDLFAGSGALGLEALSRGAAQCLFVEQDRAAIDTIRANIAMLDCGRQSLVRACSVLAMGPADQPGDLALLDPPYGSGAANVALDKLARLGWFAPSTMIAVETGRKEAVSVEGFEILAERETGKARLTLLRADSEFRAASTGPER